MPQRVYLLIFSTLLFLVAASQTTYPKNYFRNPLGIPMQLAANFGELRPNHWHMGLDIRTNQKENLPVYAAAGGYIAHIGIRPQSFGRYIIIDHPNGLSTLYGHLNDFFPALEEYVTAQQYKEETWAIEIDFKPREFPVSKGQFIAYSGNTGGSQGPHLHFEIRDTKTDECLNPLLFGFGLEDDVPPNLVKLAMYDRSRSVYEQRPLLFSLKKTDSGYIIPQLPLIMTGYNQVSFAIQAYDRLSGSSNPNGIYSAGLYLDKEPQISFSLDSLDYRETAYINAHVDYKYRADGGAFLQHLSQLPGEMSGVYKQIKSNGIIHFADTNIHFFTIDVKDAASNTSQLNFRVQFSDSLASTAYHDPVSVLTPREVNILEKPGFEIYLPEGCLYDSVQPFYYRNNSYPQYAVSAAHQLNDASIPVHEDLSVRIKPDKPVPDDWKEKLIIQRTSHGTSRRVAAWQGDWVTAKFSDLGTFQVFADIIPPEINDPGRAGKDDTIDLSPVNRIVFQPKDNFGIKSFRAELDGHWLRFTNDKGWSYIYTFDERCPYGVHELKVTVEDLVGNSTAKTWWFKKYPYTPPKKKAVKKKSSKKKTVLKKGGTKKK